MRPYLKKSFTKIGLVGWLKMKVLSSSPSTANKTKTKPHNNATQSTPRLSFSNKHTGLDGVVCRTVLEEVRKRGMCKAGWQVGAKLLLFCLPKNGEVVKILVSEVQIVWV
jgi:hypothetical protein